MSAITTIAEAITPKEYLQGERQSKVRPEYVEGHLYATAGASDGMGATLKFPKIGLEIPLDRIYERTVAPSRAPCRTV